MQIVKIYFARGIANRVNFAAITDF